MKREEKVQDTAVDPKLEKKRLQLSEEELQSLEGSELKDVVGGWPGSPAYSAY